MGLEVGGVFYLPLLVGKMILPIPAKKKKRERICPRWSPCTPLRRPRTRSAQNVIHKISEWNTGLLYAT